MRCLKTQHAVAVACAAFSGVAHGHGLLTLPSSKNGGSLATSDATAGNHFTIASFGIVDKAFFDEDHSATPWTRPGAFDWELARDLIPGHPETLHPCGCNAGGLAQCAGVEIATGFGETTAGASVDPPAWAAGSRVDVGWNAYANHAGGYVYTLCKKSTFDACRDAHLGCVWGCFEATTLEWAAGSQRVQLKDDRCAYVRMDALEKEGKGGHAWRYTPLPDHLQVSNGGEGRCTWDSVKGFSGEAVKKKFTESFGSKDVCDSGRDAHNPKEWHVTDKVKVPTNIPEGEYLLGWRWDAYMADQMWTNCADVTIVSSTNPEDGSAAAAKCTPAPSKQPAAPSPTSAPTPAVPTPPAPTAACTDFALPGNWGQNGLFDCDYYRGHGGEAYCAQTVLDEACCFCGGGTGGGSAAPTPAAAPSAACVNKEPLPGNWGGGGIYDCDHYEGLAGTAYCAHTVILVSCCFCGGGGTKAPVPAPPSPPLSAAPSNTPTVQGVVKRTGTITFKLSDMTSEMGKKKAIAAVKGIQKQMTKVLKSKKFEKKTKAKFMSVQITWKSSTFSKMKNFLELECAIALSYHTKPKIPALIKTTKKALKKKNVDAVKKLNESKFKDLTKILSSLVL